MGKNFLLSSERNNKNITLKKRILQYLITMGDSSIADICKEIELSVPTVTKLVMDLLEEGYIRDSGKLDTSGGRRPNIYGLNPESGYFVGVDVQRTRIKLALLDFSGRFVDEENELPYRLENTPEALERLCTIVTEYVHGLPVSKERVLRMGINITGRVNSVSGYSYSYFNFNEIPLAQVIEDRVGIPVDLENDSRAMAYGEYIKGAVKGEKNVLFVNINWGLGSGIIIDGKLYYGKSGFSGELGHISTFDNEILCVCGKKGCLETEASGFAIRRMVIDSYRQGGGTILAEKIQQDGDISLVDFVDAVRKEDLLCIDVVERVGTTLGRWIAGMINIFNPELVILGGPISLTGDYIRLPIKSAIKKYSLNLVNQDTDLILSKLGDKAGLVGACLLSRSKLLGVF